MWNGVKELHILLETVFLLAFKYLTAKRAARGILSRGIEPIRNRVKHSNDMNGSPSQTKACQMTRLASKSACKPRDTAYVGCRAASKPKCAV